MRTGVRSGVAPSDVWHIMGNGRATVCGRVRVKAAVRIGVDQRHRTFEDAKRQIESQGGTMCEACEACRSVSMKVVADSTQPLRPSK